MIPQIISTIIMLVGVASSFFIGAQVQDRITERQVAKPKTQIVSPSPSLKPKPSNKQSPVPQVKGVNTYKPLPVNNDPPVHCQIHVNCGGETKPLKKSECDNSICCQIGDKWILYLDKNKCKEDQNNLSKNNNYNNDNYVPLPSYEPFNYNQPTQTVNYLEENSRCKGDARSNNQTQESALRTYYRSRGSGMGSAYENALNNLYQDLLRALALCDSRYPVN